MEIKNKNGKKNYFVIQLYFVVQDKNENLFQHP